MSLDINSGETFGLLGPNGAGKTTTVNVCTTRTPPTSGRVCVAGWDVSTEAIRVRSAIGVVTQFNTLDRSCTVADNLYFHCRFFGLGHRQSKARTRELLEMFQLTAKAAARPAWLSGGMAQRLQIARAIAHRPRILFLDEPTAGLDPQSRLALWDQLAKLRSDGVTIFLTTHYMEEADQLCDRVAIIDHGRLLVAGAPADLKRASGVGTVVTLTLAHPEVVPPDQLRNLEGVRGVEATTNGYLIRTDGGQRSLARIVPAAVVGQIQDVAVREPTLETVFINLTGRDLRE
ncbi:MAG: ATP-binding cassette domain-containing protein [Micromonosporaceae bacterium]